MIKCTVEIDWEKVPEEVEYIIQDANGAISLFKKEPKPCGDFSEWYSSEADNFLKFSEIKGWKTRLWKRPEPEKEWVVEKFAGLAQRYAQIVNKKTGDNLIIKATGEDANERIEKLVKKLNGGN